MYSAHKYTWDKKKYKFLVYYSLHVCKIYVNGTSKFVTRSFG